MKTTKTNEELDYSRPLDVHTWSDFKEVNVFVNQLWDKYFKDDHSSEEGKTGKRPKAPLKKQFKVLLLDLFVAWSQDPDLLIGVGMSKASYKAGSRYNALHISFQITKIVHALHQKGLIGLHKGSEGAGRVTRIWPEQKLIKHFKKAKFSHLDLDAHSGQEVIILNNKDEGKDKAKPVEYSDEDNPEIPSMRRDLQAYNELIRRSFIDIGPLGESVIEQEYWHKKEKRYKIRRVQINHHNKFVRRVFYRSSWDLGGRFHGGFWQQIGEDWRRNILIDDVPTVEQDYSGLHINLCYGLKRKQPPKEDPYALDLLFDVSEQEQRSWVKLLSLMAINADSPKGAFSAFRDSQETGSTAKKLKNKELGMLLDAFKEKHRDIEDMICSDQGVILMNLDGKITADVINHFTRKNVPILTIHDSYITQHNYTGELRKVMNQAIEKHLYGFKINIDQDGVGIDQYRHSASQERWALSTHELLNQIPNPKRSKGYTKRLERHQQWLAHQEP